MAINKEIKRIVLTGGPGAGKTTAVDLLRREIGDQVVVVPEAATMLFSGGFPRYETEYAKRATQRAIYHVQRNLEDVQGAKYSDRVLLCDRGTLDSAIYWPGGSDHFFMEVRSSIEDELARYDAVVFFETAAVGSISIEGGNPTRNETLKQAVELDLQLREVWGKHENYHFIPHESSFMHKLNKAHRLLLEIIN